ncbi:4Fe-4S dicluster domain-containing protein [Nesterenkonia marinintestina]|uniref:4Fe-4S dicluster domain-containing protein n=1 Tax=Nesterenkonia marinintestina TaxID=2979865 RepID=UPI0021C1D176|nr:4Fe-4S dicluster domain-containing protein [Nesterenkonia sp. GX14115]
MSRTAAWEDPSAELHWEDQAQPRKGFFTDTSICIGCKACEVACKEWNRNPTDGSFELLESSYDNTGALGANTWRHVAFVEQDRDRITAARESGRQLVSLGMPGVGPPESAPSAGGAAEPPDLLAALEGGEQMDLTPPDTDEFRWLMSSDVCKHCTHAGCLDVCPTGALFRTEFGTVVVQADVCNGCGTCVAGCPFGVIERRDDGTVHPKAEREGAQRVEQDIPHQGTANKCTLCYDRMVVGETPACAKTCPTTSIKYGDHEDMVETAEARVRELHDRGMTEARLYGANPDDGVGGIGSVFLLLDEPEVYGLPPDPRVATKDLPQMYAAAGLAAAGMLAGVAAAFLGSRR